ncbi:MAG: ribulose-phosphate 3-epimerase, partial [Coriobacteriia bacterium]
EVDGGIDNTTASRVVAAGADMLVAGNAIFGADDPALALKALRSSALARKV